MVLNINPAPAVREFAAKQGLEVGVRGKLSQEVKVAFLTENPSVARTIAEANEVDVPARGKLSADSIAAIAKSFA